eukprot:9150315-Ditylum_brightwellii.AAC.1
MTRAENLLLKELSSVDDTALTATNATTVVERNCDQSMGNTKQTPNDDVHDTEANNTVRGKEEKQLNNCCSSNQHGLSYLELCRSNHRTPLLGNYSFEVLETCLRRRGVELSWYRGSDDNGDDDCVFDGKQLKQKGGEDIEEGFTIGFIINQTNNDGDISLKSKLKRFIRHVPIVGSYVGGGRHWFAITKFRYVVDDDSVQRNLTAATGKYTSPWLLFDSEEYDIVELQTHSELKKYLENIMKCGGSVFRAKMTKPLLILADT